MTFKTLQVQAESFQISVFLSISRKKAKLAELDCLIVKPCHSTLVWSQVKKASC